MPLSDPIYSSFRFYLPKDFIYESVREKVDIFYKMVDLPYEDITDYINSTITNAKLPGLSDPGTRDQITSYSGDLKYDKGRKQKFKSALQAKESITKEIDIEFHVKDSYLNWIIMYMQMVEYLDHNNDREFMPPIYLQILDDEDNIIIEFIYKEIRFNRITDIDFSKQDNGLINRQFTITFGFNDFEIKFNTDKVQSHRDSSKHQY